MSIALGALSRLFAAAVSASFPGVSAANALRRGAVTPSVAVRRHLLRCSTSRPAGRLRLSGTPQRFRPGVSRGLRSSVRGQSVIRYPVSGIGHPVSAVWVSSLFLRNFFAKGACCIFLRISSLQNCSQLFAFEESQNPLVLIGSSRISSLFLPGGENA